MGTVYCNYYGLVKAIAVGRIQCLGMHYIRKYKNNTNMYICTGPKVQYTTNLYVCMGL